MDCIASNMVLKDDNKIHTLIVSLILKQGTTNTSKTIFPLPNLYTLNVE